MDLIADLDIVTSLLSRSKDASNETAQDWRVLQPIWDLRIGYEYWLTSPLFPIVFSMLFYFALCLPWMYIDLFGRDWQWIQKYKIQPDRISTWPEIRKAIVLTMWNHVLYLLPVSMAQWVFTPDTVLPDQAPTLFQFCFHILGALTIFDLEYFIFHWAHHKSAFLYRHVHAVHHEYYLSMVWVTQYLHPWELISVGFFTTTSALAFTDHPMTIWGFMIFSIVVSVDDHIGYDLPFLPHRWCPFWGGSIKHDMHHQKPLTNFEPFYNWWDKLFGFECPGKIAGGIKPPALLKWEEDRREMFRKKNAMKKAAMENRVKQD